MPGVFVVTNGNIGLFLPHWSKRPGLRKTLLRVGSPMSQGESLLIGGSNSVRPTRVESCSIWTVETQ